MKKLLLGTAFFLMVLGLGAQQGNIIVSGSTQSTSGRGISGVVVHSQEDPSGESTQTDRSGTYMLSIKSGHSVTAEKQNYVVSSQSLSGAIYSNSTCNFILSSQD